MIPEILSPAIKFDGINEDKKFISQFTNLYGIAIFKDGLDLILTKARHGDLTFEGEMYIHDTTYAVKEIKAKISPGANINYLQDLFIKQKFEQVDKEVWMMTLEETIADLKVTKKSELYGFFARKTSSRKNFVINQPRPNSFFNENKQVIVKDDALLKDSNYWNNQRHLKITKKEAKISEMADSLNKTPFFIAIKKSLIY